MSQRRGKAAPISVDAARIDQIFAGLDQCALPGAAVGVAVGGVPVYRRGFGLASLELPVMLAPSMRMRIGSTSKHFTAFAYLRLCEEGRCSVDDPLGRHLPELNPVAREATVRQLMTNTSGLRDAMDLRWQFGGFAPKVANRDLVRLYETADEVNFAPGASWRYSNGGFALLSRLVERVAGQPLEDVLRERIFAPAGMHDTLLRRGDDDFVPNSATLHMTGADGRYSRDYLAGDLAGEGGLVSTVDDLLRWLAHMSRPTVGTAETWALMTTPFVLTNGVSSGYGMGLTVGDYRGVRLIHHAGGVKGGSAQMLKAPDHDLDVVVLCNRQDISAIELADRILDACLRDLAPRVKGERVDIAEGVYRSEAGRVLKLVAGDRETGEWKVHVDGAETPFLGVGGRLIPDPNGSARSLQWAIERRPGGVRFSDFGQSKDFAPLGAGVGPRAIAGDYRSSEAAAEVSISEAGEGATLRTRGPWGAVDYRLEPWAEGVWRARAAAEPSLGGLLDFNGPGEGFAWWTYCNSALRFERLAAAA